MKLLALFTAIRSRVSRSSPLSLLSLVRSLRGRLPKVSVSFYSGVAPTRTFLHHTPSAPGLGKIRDLRLGFSDLQRAIETLAPNSRERAVALTNLETAAMWAIKAIVLNDPESVPEPLPEKPKAE